MNKAYLLTGGNLGNRAENLQRACTLIEQECGQIVQQSSLYETAAWGVEDQPDFYNQVLLLHTALAAESLMHRLLGIETTMGRRRETHMGARIIDIDILFFNNDIIDEPNLTIPHPRMQLRKFVLMPLAEIAAGYEHPVLHKTVSALLTECSDSLNVYKIG